MAADDTMWFELGVRDNVSKTLTDLMDKAIDLQDAMDSIKIGKGIYENALKIEQAYDRIAVALRKIEEARTKTKDSNQLNQLNKSESKLKDIRTAFEKIASSEDMMAMKGTSAFTAIREGLQLALAQIDRYTKGIDDQSRAEEKHKNDELRRTDELKAKYNELERYRKQWMDAINNSAPGMNLGGDVRRIGQSLDYRANQVAAAISGGGSMPKSATGADYDKFISHMKEKLREITAETDAYNNSLARNESIQRSLMENMKNTASKQRIAEIKGEIAEREALDAKIKETSILLRRVEEEHQKMTTQGTSYKPVYTQERISEELAAIQRRYNEELARNQQEERKTADAKKTHEAAVRNMINANRDLISIYNRVEEAGRRNNTILDQMKNQLMGFAGLYGIERLLKNVIQIGGEFEVQHIALQSILGDVQQANSMFEQMKELAVVSPFNFRQLAAYTKQVAAFGIPYEEMYDTTKRLADMSAGLGVDMGRLILAYGQVRSAAVLRGQELRQFTEAGIPLVQELAKEFTKLNGRAVSTAEVFELISKRAVPFEMVKKIMWDMTNEGGRFFNMQFTLSDTLAGKWSNLRDAWEIMLSEFAKGESLSGKFLKGVVTLTTKILESMNTLMPLIGGGLLFVGVKNLTDAVTGMGMMGIKANVTKTQQLYAIELKRKYVNQEITREQYNQGLQLTRNKDLVHLQLAQEGKLKAYQIQKLMLEKNITNEKLHELVAAEKITMREAAQIRLWRMKYGQMSAARVAMMEMASGAGKFLKANGWLIALDVIVTTVYSVISHFQELKAKNEELKTSFENASKSIRESYESIKSSDLGADADYSSAISGLKEMLKEHSANYDAIMRHANGIDDLKGQYEYLKEEMANEVEVTEEAEKMAEKFGESTRSAFEKAKDAARDFIRKGYKDELIFDDETGYGSTGKKVEGYVRKIYDEIAKQIPEIGKDEQANELYRKLRNSIEEQLGFGREEKMLVNIKLNELFQIDNVEDATTLVVDKFGEMLKRSNVAIANKMLYESGELDDAEAKKVDELVKKAASDTIDKYPYYKDTLQGLLNNSDFVANIRLRFVGEGNANDYQKQIYGNMPSVLPETTKALATSWGKGGSSYAARNAAKTEIDNRKNELEAREREYRKGKTTADRVKKARDAYQEALDAANYGYGYDYEGELKKSNKTPKSKSGGSKKDTQLEAWKAEFNELKAFYSEYKRWAQLIGKDAALKKIQEEGLFSGMFSDGKPIYDINDWGKALDSFRKKTASGTAARNEFQTALKKEKLTFDYDINKEAIDKVVHEIQEYLTRSGEQWNLFKNLFDKTGSREFAMRAFDDGMFWNEQTEEWRKKLMELAPNNVIDWRMTDAEAKEAFKGIEGGYEIWKKIVDTVRNEYKDALLDTAEAVKANMGYAQQMSSIYAKYAEKISRARLLGDPNAEYSLKRQMEEELASVDFEKLKDEINWEAVFGNLDLYTKSSLKKVKAQLDKFRSSKQYRNFGTEKLKAFEEGYSRLTDAINSREGLFTGTKNAVIEYRDAVAKLVEAEYEMVRAENEFGKNSAQYEDAMKKRNQAQENAMRAQGNVQGRRMEDLNKITEIGNLFASLGRGNSVLSRAGSIYTTIAKLFGGEKTKTNSEQVGGLIGMFAGLTEAIADKGIKPFLSEAFQDIFTAVGSIFDAVGELVGIKGLGGIFRGADYTQYEKMKAAYEQLIGVWDDLIDRKRTYLKENWGTEAQQAGEEAKKLLQTEIEQTKVLAKARLDAGVSAGSHSIAYRMWKGSYDYEGTNWRDVADDISRALNGVKFTSMEDMLNMSSEQLLWIKENYVGLWATMDDDFKKHLDNIIKYNEDIVDLTDELTEKLTGMRFSDMVSSYTSTLSTMSNGNDQLAQDLENKLKNAILNGMIQNIYGDRIKQLIKNADAAGQNSDRIYDETGRVVSEFTKAEWDAIKAESDALNADMEARRNMLMDLYGWSDDGSSSSSASSSIKGVSEQTADLLASYVNAIRADVSVKREILMQILTQVQVQQDLPVIARAQLTQLESIAASTRLNAEFAEGIFDILHASQTGAKRLEVKAM